MKKLVKSKSNMKKTKRLYDDNGHWLTKPEVVKISQKVGTDIRKMMEHLLKKGWCRLDVERAIMDAVRYEGVMLALKRIANNK